jgi:putative CocE/NonD family hydrolase
MTRRPSWVLLALAAAVSIVAASSGHAVDPAPSHEVTVQYNVMVPMSDGVRLATDIYRPRADGRYPVILVRNPYHNGSARGMPESGRFYAAQGYVFLHQDTRGRYDSEGAWDPLVNEARDGHDAIEWAAVQPWSNGRVGMLGVSYLAHVQWLAAGEGSPHLKAMIPTFSPMLGYRDVHRGGAFELTRIKWATLMDGRTRQEFEYDWEAILRHLPLIDMDLAAGHDARFWRALIRHPSYDTYWERMDVRSRLGKIRAASLNIGGWYDPFLTSTLKAFRGMVEEGGSPEARSGQRLLIGPWRHGGHARSSAGILDFGPRAALDLDEHSLRWFDFWLKGEDTGVEDEAPVRIFVMGENRWRDEREWPLARSRFTKYFLSSGGSANTRGGDGILTTEPPGHSPPDRFVYDPRNPVPTRGGNLPGASPGLEPGPFDHGDIEDREDVLVYSTAPMTIETEVTGPLTVVLYAASSAPDTDFTAKLLDVYPDGRAINLADGAVRARYRDSLTRPALIEPGVIYEYRIDLVATSNLFRRGHRIRVEISSSNFARFDRNPNTGHDFGVDAEVRAATQTVHHDRQRPSHILLPVILENTEADAR